MLALDIATKMGVAFDEDGQLFVQTVEGDPIFQLEHILELGNYNIFIEDLKALNSPNPKTLADLSQRVGYIRFSLLNERCTVEMVHTGTWRKFLGIKSRKRNEIKKETKAKVEFNIDFKITDDEADAISIWLYGQQLQYDDLANYTIHKLKKLTQPKNERVSI